MIRKSITFDEITALKKTYFEAAVEHEQKIYWSNAGKELEHELATNLKISENALKKAGMASRHIYTINGLAKQEAERRKEEADGRVTRDWNPLLRDIGEWSLGRQ